MKRGTLSNNLDIFYRVIDAFWRLLTTWIFHQFDFEELMDATMTFIFFISELFFLGNVFIFSLLPATNV